MNKTLNKQKQGALLARAFIYCLELGSGRVIRLSKLTLNGISFAA
jgi:hypothetical protein